MTPVQPKDSPPAVMQFGKHKGTPITRLPVSYLRWMVAEDVCKSIALDELKRRGTSLVQMEITAHALDRASLRLLGMWKKRDNPGEGLHAWLNRLALEADKFRKDSREEFTALGTKVIHKGIVFGFSDNPDYPTLLTVYRANP